MRLLSQHPGGPRGLLAVALLVLAGAFSPARAALVSYTAVLDGASESPPNASAGTGFAQVDVDAAAHTMRVQVVFSGLTGTTTASHIHAATTLAGSGTAGVATAVPTFPGFPLGVTSGTYDTTFDMTQAASYNPSFVAAHGGTTALAEAFLLQSLADGKAYLNIHSSFAAGGEIRGFLAAVSVPADATSWGEAKTLYR